MTAYGISYRCCRTASLDANKYDHDRNRNIGDVTSDWPKRHSGNQQYQRSNARFSGISSKYTAGYGCGTWHGFGYRGWVGCGCGTR